MIGLAVVLMVTALILWRPFGSSSPSQLNRSETDVAQSPRGLAQSNNIAIPTRTTPPPERVLHFPGDHSIGTLRVRDWNSPRGSGWNLLAKPDGTVVTKAQGTVTVPPGMELNLIIDGYPAHDLSFLAELGEHDLQALALVGEVASSSVQSNGRIKIEWNTTITDDVLRFIQGLLSLRHLNLVGAKISDAGLTHLSGLASLEELYLAYTDIGDAGMAQIGSLSSIRVLEINGTSVTDEGLAELKRLPQLRRLILGGNPQITDAGLSHLRSLTRLEVLDLSRTSITDTGLVFLQSIRSLKELNLNVTQVTLDGLESLRQALPNCQIRFDGKVVPTLTPTPSPQPPVS